MPCVALQNTDLPLFAVRAFWVPQRVRNSARGSAGLPLAVDQENAGTGSGTGGTGDGSGIGSGSGLGGCGSGEGMGLGRTSGPPATGSSSGDICPPQELGTSILFFPTKPLHEHKICFDSHLAETLTYNNNLAEWTANPMTWRNKQARSPTRFSGALLVATRLALNNCRIFLQFQTRYG
jgi:hypothetical protein